MTTNEADGPPAPARRHGWGIDDIVLVPLAVVAFLAVTLLRWAWKLLVYVLDDLFALVMQVVRFVLFVLRILGDAAVGLVRLVIRILPVGGRRQSWREAVARAWAWLRAKISYTAFEHWLHHLFEDGMAWTFRVCRRLSPTGALLVILLAAVWVPVSFFAATAAHAYLIAEAANLPPWMQSLHVVATTLAKSKLLMLPAYPAAWPQAKQHGIVQACFRLFRFIAGLALVRKAGQRYDDVDRVATRYAQAFLRWAENAGLAGAVRALGAAIGGAVSGLAGGVRAALGAVARVIAMTPWLGPVLRGYAEQYARDAAIPREKLSRRMKDFLERWRIKFSPAYYEEKEREAAALRQSGGSTGPPA